MTTNKKTGKKRNLHIKERRIISGAIRFTSDKTLKHFTRYSDKEVERLRNDLNAYVSLKEFNRNRAYNVNIEKNIPKKYEITLDSKDFTMQEKGKQKNYNFSKSVTIEKPDNSFIEINAYSHAKGKRTKWIKTGFNKSVRSAIEKMDELVESKREYYAEKYGILLKNFKFHIWIVHEGFRVSYKI